MAAQNNTTQESIRVTTSVGDCTIRRRSRYWYARIQRGRVRQEICLRTDDPMQAVAVAQEIVPNYINGTPALLNASLPMEKHYRLIYNNTKGRAKQSGIEFSLTPEDWDLIVRRAGGRCELTGIQFNLAKAKTGFRAPLAPSVDRINCGFGYTKSNVRFVCVAVNWALSDWGVNVFEAIATAYVGRKFSQTAGALTEQLFSSVERNV